MIELDPSCDTWMVSGINFSIFTIGFPPWDKFPSRGDVVFTNCYFVKYILFEVTIGYIFE